MLVAGVFKDESARAQDCSLALGGERGEIGGRERELGGSLAMGAAGRQSVELESLLS